ncbi:Uncharacterized membrane protein YcaP, DUF421 family [Propionispora vibrioides]|uniref:Uncharacterized membrane protein YcaP, DUF421 family n=1 Tax=Propionispora vibrioides TaxID=112903 RepID=A0A1H8SEM5_9FIRM|nr:Uncharacterized membrane protein YcaP, DUF421 family [Propionispora vibrioides]
MSDHQSCLILAGISLLLSANNSDKRGDNVFGLGEAASLGEIGRVFLHIILFCTAALIVVRIMGNRTVGQLSPFDFVIMVGIGDIIVSAAMDKTQTLLTGVEALLALLLLQQLLSYLSLKSTRLRTWFEGTPVTLIKDGKIIKENFADTYFNYDDLRQELHRQGMDITDLKDIKTGRLESCGVFSVIKNPEAEPVCRRDFDDYIASMFDNPLSPMGAQMVKLEKLAEDVSYIREYLQQPPGRYDAPASQQPLTEKEIH